MKKLLILIPAFILCFLPGTAPAVRIDDTTLVGVGRTDTGDKWYRNEDALGQQDYDIFYMDAVIAGGTLGISIFSNFDGSETAGGVDIRLADLMLDTDGIAGYEYGIVLSEKEGLSSGSIYKNPTWKTSHSYLDGKTSGNYEYGEFLYWESSENFKHVNTHIIDGTPTNYSAALGAFPEDIAGHDPGYRYDISSIPLDNLGWSGSDDIGIFFAGATCANDIIEGTLPVPEPSTLVLFGTGVVGLAGVWRKVSKR